MGTYRGLNISGGLRANFKKLRVKKTIDEMEISDRGAITGTPSDLTTRGAAHRRGRNNNQRRGASGATRESVDYGFITGAGSNIVQEHDYGTVIETTTSLSSAAFETRRSLGLAASIADEETAVAPTAAIPGSVSLYNSTGIIPAGAPLILNSDGTVSAVTGGSYFGSSLDMSIPKPNMYRSVKIRGDKIVAGAEGNAVYVFDKNTGSEILSIPKPSDGSSLFGWGVDVNDDYVAVTDRNANKAFVFNMSDGSLRHTLTKSTSGNHMFSNSVALFGDKVVVSSYQETDGYGARMYSCVNGSQLRDYRSTHTNANHPSGGTEYHFGRNVTMNSQYVFATHPGHDIHVFSHSSNNSIATISDSGGWMDCDETYLAIGSYSAGRVNIYDMATFNLIRTITPPITINDFGWGVSISGNYIVVDCYNQGRVFVFDITTGNHLTTIESPDGDLTYPGTYFGFGNGWSTPAVAIGDNGDGSARVAVSHRFHPEGPRLHLFTVGNIETTNLTEDNYIGFAGSEFSYDGSLGQVITAPGIVTGLSGLVADADYYLQNDGTVSTNQTDILLGKATSNTVLELSLPTGMYGDLGVVAGGNGTTEAVQYFNIATGGTATAATSVGTMYRMDTTAVSNALRGVFGGGYPGTTSIDYLTFATLGNATSFSGTMYTQTRRGGAVSDGTYGVWANGKSPSNNTIQYLSIATEGNASYWGGITANDYNHGGMSNGTIGIFGSGSAAQDRRMRYITIATQGTAASIWAYDNGYSTTYGHTRYSSAICSNDTRGLIAGGNPLTSTTDIITYLTMATQANTSLFGNLTQKRGYNTSSVNQTRATFSGGSWHYTIPGTTTGTAETYDIIDYVTIDTTGAAADFGNLVKPIRNAIGTSGNA